MDLGSGNHFEASWAGSWLIVNWAFRGIATASVLWATLTFGSGQNRADTVTDWSWWAEFWFVNADVIVTGAAKMVITVDVNSNWEFFDEASKFSRTVFDDWNSAVFWVTDTLELWTAVSFSGTFFTVSAGSGDFDGDFFISEAVSLFISFSSFGTSGSVA